MMQRRLDLDLEVSNEFGTGLAWYTAAEASFMANIYQRKDRKELRLEYRIGLRADDRPLLEYIRDILGIGQIYAVKAMPSPHRRGAKPQARYRVERISDLYHVIVPFFQKYPLPPQAKKSRDFEVWKKIVEIDYHEGKPRGGGRSPGGKYLGHKPLPQSYWDKIEPLVEQLKAIRKFKE